MTERQGGLRFDIYERVHLSEGVAGIKELEEVELVPHIQVLPQGDQALLRGNLLLSGAYVDEQDAVNRTLEHLIPVEITLPMNRVNRMEDIAVEIENFDVDVLSSRSLNITGVLSLNGLETEPSAPAKEWEELGEESVFSNEALETSEPGKEAEPFRGQAIAVEESVPEKTSPWIHIYSPGSPEDQRGDWEADRREPPASHEANMASETSEPAHPAKEEEVQGVTADLDEKAAAEPAGTEPDELEPDDAIAASIQPEEKKDMKIAFSGKKTEEEQHPSASMGLASLVQKHASNKQELRNEEPPSPTVPAASAGTGDKLEWKKLLLHSSSEQQEFKRLRLCIVQKEDTLDSIAKRYDLNPREIALFNRLGENNVTEGQIVYIPK